METEKKSTPDKSLAIHLGKLLPALNIAARVLRYPRRVFRAWREEAPARKRLHDQVPGTVGTIRVSRSPQSIPDLQARLADTLYFAEHSLATAIFLTLKLGKPLFLEGEAGVGKTEVATLLDTRLIRLQCYEGLDVSTAVYG